MKRNFQQAEQQESPGNFTNFVPATQMNLMIDPHHVCNVI